MPDRDEAQEYYVVINDEEQHSIWLTSREMPRGWRPIHGPAAKEACLAYIAEHWTDMRPKSLREAMDGAT